MALQLDRRVPELTALLTVVSLALVFGAVLGQLPVALLPRAPEAVFAAIPHLNAVLSALAIPTIGLGWYWIRRGQVDRHRRAMATAVVLFAGFLVLYLYRVAVLGPTEFTGPAAVERFLYLPLLAVHILLAVVCIPLLYYVLLLALTRPVERLRGSRHRQIGRVVAPLWMISFALGLAVYLLLYVVY
jgi:putative membrane protein